MDETAKYKARNIVSAIAYFLLALLAGLFVSADLVEGEFVAWVLYLIEGLVACAGIVLLVLKKRDVTALAFLMFGSLFAFYTATGGVRFSTLTFVICWFFILIPLLFTFTKEKKAVTYFCIFLPYGFGAIFYGYMGEGNAVILAIHIFEGCYALLLGLLYLLERVKIHLALKIRADEAIPFTRCGPVFGLYLLSVFCIVAPVAILTGSTGSGNILRISLVCGVCLALTAVLLWIFARQRVGAVLMMLAGIAIPLVVFSDIGTTTGSVPLFVIGVMFLGAAAGALIRKKWVMVSLMFQFIGVVYLLIGLGVVVQPLNAVLLFIAGLIGIYLTLAILAKRPLPIR